MRDKLFTLTRKQRDDLERRYKQTTERRIGDRIQAILLLSGGRSAREVAEILHVSQKTLKRWVKVFAKHGIEQLCTLKYEGSEAPLTTEQFKQFEAWLDESIRTTKEAIAWVEAEFDYSYSESGMVKVLSRMGYSYKKPAQVPSKADPVAQAAWVDRYLEKRGSGEGA